MSKKKKGTARRGLHGALLIEVGIKTLNAVEISNAEASNGIR